MFKKLNRAMLLIVIAAIALAACSRAPMRDSRETVEFGAPAAAPTMVAAEPAMAREESAKLGTDSALGGASASLERKIIYNVSLHLIVQDTEKAFSEVQRVAQEMGGFVAGSNVWRDQEYQRASLTVRVPADKLEDALARFRALAVDIENQQLDSQDVTEEYVDLEARLTNAQRTERELQELLDSRSEKGKTSDILEVYRELTSIREQIEQIQGRMKYLDNLSSMATVQIQLTPDALLRPVVVAGWRPQGTVREAVRRLLRALQFLVDAAIYLILLVLPILIALAIPIVALIWLIRALVRGRKRRQAKRAAAQEPEQG